MTSKCVLRLGGARAPRAPPGSAYDTNVLVENRIGRLKGERLKKRKLMKIVQKFQHIQNNFSLPQILADIHEESFFFPNKNQVYEKTGNNTYVVG